jgi:hypothetical protein
MKKILAVLSLAAAIPTAAFADNVGGCGVGSKLFDGQSGVAPQVFAVTTNGSTANQTFGISSGTLGCTQDGTVRSDWKMSMFIEGNKERLARDMSVGSGETLASLAHLLGVEAQDQPAFNRLTKDNLARIFPSESAGTDQIIGGLRQTLASDPHMARYLAAI